MFNGPRSLPVTAGRSLKEIIQANVPKLETEVREAEAALLGRLNNDNHTFVTSLAAKLAYHRGQLDAIKVLAEIKD